ncbi:MAG: VOC family protein [Planctomycetota bacterium]
MTQQPKLLRVRWIDQITGQPKQTADFYTDLLGFNQSPHDEGNGYTSYSLVDEQGKEIFGIVEQAVFPDWHHGWVLYFEAEDFEAQCDRIESLGGQIIRREQSQCLFKDPAGAPTVLVKAAQ